LPEDSVDVWELNFENCQEISDFGNLAEKNWLLGIPLSIKGTFYGALIVQETNVQPAFHNKRIELIKGVAQQITLALQNEFFTKEMVNRERIEREFQLAREIQKAFLPEDMLAIPGWDLDIRWQTARQVGGDFYDFFQIGDGSLAIVIADVSDKGMPAALYMTVTRTLIRATALSVFSPASILERVNALLEMESRNGMFVTAFMAIIDPKTGLLTYANAGHNLPIWKKYEGKECTRLERDGIALGVTSEAKYNDIKIILKDNDFLFFYTDGVTEAISDTGQFFTEQRLFNLIQKKHFSNSKKLLSLIENEVREFRNGESPYDDLTMICLHRKK